MRNLRLPIAAAIAALVLFAPLHGVAPAAFAQTPTIIAVVNDQPVTELDLTQRIAMLEIVESSRDPLTKQQALKGIIDDAVKVQEAKKFNMLPSDADVNDRIDRIAKNLKMTRAQLVAKLKEKGVPESTLRNYLQADMGITRIIQAKYRDDLKASPAEVSAKTADIKAKVGDQMAKIMADPRMKPINVYKLMEIDLPVDGNDPMLLQSRAIEAAQVLQRLKGCGSLKAASQGIFDVKQGKTFEADGAKLPPKMKAALDKAGVGRAVGPMRSKDGIQIIALCETRKLVPPKPNFDMPGPDQIERIVLNEKYDKYEEDYLQTARDKVYVEYRDPAYAQQ